jgi:soluble lytic murein transglycosylase-like protein
VRRFPRAAAAAAAFLAVTSGAARPAYAELAFFANGRSLSIKGHAVDGNSLVLTLRNGGQMVVGADLITRFEPDEVPYPEPEPEIPPPTAAAPARTGPSPYDHLIEKYSKAEAVDARLVRAMIQVESGYRERARSRRGAMGLMQLMPETARQYGVSNPYDPASNIEAGVKHLKSLLQRLPTDLALAAYNAGEATVERFRGIPPYPETRSYVARILDLVRP